MSSVRDSFGGVENTKYTLTGRVESVSYVYSKGWPCYVAVKDDSCDSSKEDNLYFHAANQHEMCAFAERCKHLNVPVKIIGEKYPGQSSALVAIEFANTNAKYYIDPFTRITI